MSLTLYFHPFSSFCQKVLIALYENATPFQPKLIDLGDLASRAELEQIWPICKFPVLRDEARDWTIPESSTIIEYLAQHYPGPSQLVPTDPDLARQVRMRDRFFDNYVEVPMQKIVADRLRPADKKDPFGVDQARRQLQVSLDMTERAMAKQTWAIGEQFTMADCAAAPGLYYVQLVQPFDQSHPHATAYFRRLMARPSFARVVSEAEPYRKLFPQ
jgi:glutathione S-transferase